METQAKQRSYDILQRLSKHGPLSTTVLNKMLESKMKPKKLRQAIYRLKNNGLVDERVMWENSRHNIVLWQVSKDFLNEPTSQNIFKYDRDNLLRMRTTRGCLLSHEMREYWIFLLSRILPKAEVVRRDQITGSKEACRVLNFNGEPDKKLPDYLIFFSDVNDERLCIAFDFEELRFSNETSLQRLKNYARNTKLDGCIFVSMDGYVHETSRLMSRAVKHDLRLRKLGYSNIFFTFSNAHDCMSNPLNQLMNANGQPISFEDWYVQISAYKQACLNSSESE